MKSLSKSLLERVRALLEAEPVDQQRREQILVVEALEKSLLEEFSRRCQEQRFTLAQVQVGESQHIDIMPYFRRKPIDIDELNALAQSGQARVPRLAETNRKHSLLKEELRLLLAQLRQAALKVKEGILEIEKEAVREGLKELAETLMAEFPYSSLEAWSKEMIRWIAERVEEFKEEENDNLSPGLTWGLSVNLLVNNRGRNEPPIIFENAPTFTNLFGSIERPTDENRNQIDFNDIKGGSLLRANGGYLVINANDAVSENGVWRNLSRVLKTRELEILSPEQFFNPGAGSILKPDPIAVDLKVIVVGDDELYRFLDSSSEEFRRIFKIKADFDDLMPMDERGLKIYAHHAWRVAEEEKLPPVEDSALAALAEHGVRLAERQDRLSTRFSELTDLLREAGHYARMESAEGLQAAHIQQALKAQNRRHCLTADHFFDLLRSGVVDLATEGSVLGVANALTVVSVGDFSFGQPCRISASYAPGRLGIISVEREVSLSGRIHDKGTLLLSAYLRAHYLPERILALSATIAFEQLHAEVDGDSASVAETVALLSALADIPVKQGIAMTGAVDQRGRVQAVGGLNEKIEGFFRVCNHRGLTGEQGIILPFNNCNDLVLSTEVIEAVEQGNFHIWAVSHLDEVLSLVSGVEAGVREQEEDAQFPEGSFNARVEERLKVLSKKAEKYFR